MFGNVPGWISALIIAALTSGLIYWKGRPEGISAPTGTLKLAMTSAALKVDPKSIVPPGTRDEDGGQYYRQAANDVVSKAKTYEKFQKAQGPAKRKMAAELQGEIDLLVKAAGCSKLTLSAANPKELVSYANAKPLLPDLQLLGNTTVNVAAFFLAPGTTTKDPKKGRQYLEAVFHLGRCLYEERLSFDEFRIGLELMANAAGRLQAYKAIDTSQNDAFTSFLSGCTAEPYITTWLVVSGIPEEGKMAAAPGDIFRLAQESGEPMWRAEATLKLGRMYWMKGVRYGDQQGAKRIVEMLSAKTDLPPNVKAAAAAAQDIINSADGRDKFNRIGGTS